MVSIRRRRVVGRQLGVDAPRAVGRRRRGYNAPMDESRWAWIDGVGTALAVAAAMLAAGALAGQPLAAAVGRWFYAGVGLMVAGGVVGAVRRRPPRGLAWRWRGRTEAASGGRNAWLDRWITRDNAWFVAGAVLVALSLAGAWLTA